MLTIQSTHVYACCYDYNHNEDLFVIFAIQNPSISEASDLKLLVAVKIFQQDLLNA